MKTLRFPRLKTYGVLTLVAALFFTSPHVTNAQKVLELMQQDNINFYEVQKEAEAYFAANGTGKGSGYKLYKRWEYFASRNIDDDGMVISDRTVWDERKRFDRKYGNRGDKARAAETWEELGPFDWSRTSSWSPGLGRITCIAVEPNNQQLIYAGSPGGGVWKSTDAGNNFTPLGDQMLNMSIWSVAIDPVNSDIVYIGNSSGKVMRTTNGGTTWLETADDIFGTPKAILINPQNTSEIWVGTSSGIFHTTTSGGSWTRIFTTKVEDMEYKPGSNSVIYACGDSFFRSTNSGQSFATAGTGFVDTERMKLEVTPANNNYVYLIQKEGSGYGRIYRSTNGGDSFSIMSDINSGATNYLGSQAGRDMAIACSDTDPNEIHIGGLDYYRSYDGGANFTKLAGWNAPTDPSYVHADIEVLEYLNGSLYCGSDGGIYRSTDEGNTMEDLTRKGGLAVRQYYRIGTSFTDEYMIVGGAQDNGTNITEAPDYSFIEWLGADGMECFIDYNNSQNVYGTSQRGSMYKSTNGGLTRFSISKPSGVDDGNWVTPFEIDPEVSTTIYVGFDQVYRHTGGGTTGSWVGISSSVNAGGNIDEIALAPSDNDYIYFANNSNMWRTKNGSSASPTWTSVNSFSGNVNYISVDPNDPEHVALACTGSRVYESFNAGDTWTDISGNLPSVGVECVVIDDRLENGIYCGMQTGIYYVDNTSSTWEAFYTGLPNVEVTELEIHYPTRQIRAGTYGRGIWQAPLYGESIDVDISANGATTFCTGGSVELTSTTDPGWTYQWQLDGAPISGATGTTYTALVGGNYSMSVNDGSSTGESESIFVDVTGENPPLTNEYTNCGPGNFDMIATPIEGGSIVWYDSENGGNVLGSNATLAVSPNVTTSYWAEETAPGTGSAGAVDNTMGGGGSHAGGFYLVFDAYQSFVLKSALVYATGAGTRTFTLKDENDVVLLSQSLNVPDGESRVQLDWTIPVGNNMRIGAESGANLFRNNAGVSYPYDVSNVLSIHGSTASTSASFYYYLYDWVIESSVFPGCSSPRGEATVNIITQPAAPTVTGGSVCEPGGIVELTAVGGNGTLNWYDSQVDGSLVTSGQSYSADVTTTTSYYVEELDQGTVSAVGPTDNSFGGGGFHNGGFYLVFDAEKEFELKDVKVYANGTADRTLELFDAQGTLINSAIINIPDGESRINVDWVIPVGDDYEIGFAAGADMFRNNDAVSYPYEIAGLVSIHASTASTPGDYYYYLYDWNIVDPSAACAGPRAEVIAEVSVCTVVQKMIEDEGAAVYPNPTQDVLNIALPADVEVGEIILSDSRGTIVWKGSGVENVVDVNSLTPGVYLVEMLIEGQLITKKIMID